MPFKLHFFGKTTSCVIPALQTAGVVEVQLCRTDLSTTHISVFRTAGDGPPPTGRGPLIPRSYASAAPFVPQSLRQHQQQPAPAMGAAPQSLRQQHHQWQPVPASRPEAPQASREQQQQPAALAAACVAQSAPQQQRQHDPQAEPSAPQFSRQQLEEQLPPQGRDPAQAPNQQQQAPAHLQAAAPAEQLPLPPHQGQALAGQSMGQSVGVAGQYMTGQSVGVAGQNVTGQYVAGQALPMAGQSVAQAMAQSMAQSMGMTVEGMLAYNLAYQDQLRRQQLGARAAAERALRDLHERRQQGLQQGDPQGGAAQGMDGQGVQQVGAVPCAALASGGNGAANAARAYQEVYAAQCCLGWLRGSDQTGRRCTCLPLRVSPRKGSTCL